MALDIFTSFYFLVAMPSHRGSTDTSFQEVSGLSKEMNTEDIVGGGENRFKYRLPTTTVFQNLVLKRGVSKKDSPLLTWCSDTLEDGFTKAITPKDIHVKLLNSKGNPCMAWNFMKAYPVKWSGAELNSEKNALFIETIELAYQYFTSKIYNK